jgi:hypothetical protein
MAVQRNKEHVHVQAAASHVQEKQCGERKGNLALSQYLIIPENHAFTETILLVSCKELQEDCPQVPARYCLRSL